MRKYSLLLLDNGGGTVKETGCMNPENRKMELDSTYYVLKNVVSSDKAEKKVWAPWLVAAHPRVERAEKEKINKSNTASTAHFRSHTKSMRAMNSKHKCKDISPKPKPRYQNPSALLEQRLHASQLSVLFRYSRSLSPANKRRG